MDDSDKLRSTRLVYYQQDIDHINNVISEFMRLSGTKCCLLIDKEGHMITRQGGAKGYDFENISALAAGSFAATREMAKLLGEKEFSVLFHQGKSDNLQLSLVGDRTLMAILFDTSTTIGMVRLYAREATERLGQILGEAAKRAAPPDQQISKDYGDSAKKTLDEFFKA